MPEKNADISKIFVSFGSNLIKKLKSFNLRGQPSSSVDEEQQEEVAENDVHKAGLWQEERYRMFLSHHKQSQSIGGAG